MVALLRGYYRRWGLGEEEEEEEDSGEAMMSNGQGEKLHVPALLLVPATTTSALLHMWAAVYVDMLPTNMEEAPAVGGLAQECAAHGGDPRTEEPPQQEEVWVCVDVRDGGLGW